MICRASYETPSSSLWLLCLKSLNSHIINKIKFVPVKRNDTFSHVVEIVQWLMCRSKDDKDIML